MAAPAAPSVQAYPAPGTSAASPQTGVSFRGVPAAGLGAIQVVGSSSGVHAGTVTAHPDGRGATFAPRQAFTPGETVTVRTRTAVAGSRGGAFGFTVGRPGRHPGVLLSPDERGATNAADAAREGVQRSGASVTAALAPTQHFRSRPDLRPPGVNISVPAAGTAPGLLMATPYGAPDYAGMMIFDNAGRLVWFRPTQQITGDLKVIRYRGQDALTWFEGTPLFGPGSYRGVWPILDDHYDTVATVRAGSGYQADLHDLVVTATGTAYLLIYNPVVRDLTSIGGPANATVLELVIQEVDISSGAVMFEWHSLDHVPLGESYRPPTALFDYIHGNSLAIDTDGNLLLSARNTSTVYKIDRSGGDVLWRLGGKRSDFSFVNDPAGGNSFQHDVRRASDGTLSMFDNGNTHSPPYSRAVRYRLDLAAHTATLVEQLRHRPDLFADTQGNNQELPGGHRLVSWGGLGVLTEYTAAGTPVLEMSLSNTGTYRTLRYPWRGRPTQPPAVLAVPDGAGSVTAYASWNGATEVASWQVLAGADAGHLRPAGGGSRTGFETAITVRTNDSVLQVRALDSSGTVLGTSPVVPAGRWFRESTPGTVNGSYRPLVGDFGAGSGTDDIFWYAAGSGPESLWLSDGGGGFRAVAMPAVNGSYDPLVGDFVGDAREEILWRSPGSAEAFLWRFDAGQPQISRLSVPAQVTRALVLGHDATLGGGQHAEVLWYAAGSAADRVDRYVWPLGGSASPVSRAVGVSGSYQPVTGDFDGNGWADVLWYGPGSEPDSVWLLSGSAATGSIGQRSVALTVNGSYTPLVGRFGRAADRRDDVLWYSPGSGADYLWESAGDGTFASSSQSNTAAGTPVVLAGGARDSVLLWPGGDGTIWAATQYGMQTRPAGNTPIPLGYQPVAGTFTGDVSSIFWYGAGFRPELLFRPLLP